ncbi:hypothetical protein BDV96DRAFT_84156 [Lophiotrema nucula]|uniref:C2H2-type domain-containing protein n=1 Tax=Lophiotrema nucula TaxID=690887 RepID=A0A6A5Z5L7_9PLEO|nr:hypothetical protein BDV96DRAFT_84156 [Lophiotrema nucula]
MCYQVVERYSTCQCLYYKHAVDPCAAQGQRGHNVQEKKVLVGDTCAQHPADASESKKRIREIEERLRHDEDVVRSSSNDEIGSQKKKKKKKTVPVEEERRRIRCPFYLNSPKIYGEYQACSSGMGFEDMARLRYHLKRVHTQPLRCPCCQSDMQSKAALKSHLRSGQRCEILPEPKDDRINQEQWEKIDAEGRCPSNNRTIEEKYKRIYQALFGMEVDVPSPFERSFIMPQVAGELAKAMDKVLSRTMVSDLAKIKAQIPAIIKVCLEQLAGTSESSDLGFQNGAKEKTSFARFPSPPQISHNDEPGLSSRHDANSRSTSSMEDSPPISSEESSLRTPILKEPTLGSSAYLNDDFNLNGWYAQRSDVDLLFIDDFPIEPEMLQTDYTWTDNVFRL